MHGPVALQSPELATCDVSALPRSRSARRPGAAAGASPRNPLHVLHVGGDRVDDDYRLVDGTSLRFAKAVAEKGI